MSLSLKTLLLSVKRKVREYQSKQFPIETVVLTNTINFKFYDFEWKLCVGFCDNKLCYLLHPVKSENSKNLLKEISHLLVLSIMITLDNVFFYGKDKSLFVPKHDDLNDFIDPLLKDFTIYPFNETHSQYCVFDYVKNLSAIENMENLGSKESNLEIGFSIIDLMESCFTLGLNFEFSRVKKQIYNKKENKIVWYKDLSSRISHKIMEDTQTQRKITLEDIMAADNRNNKVNIINKNNKMNKNSKNNNENVKTDKDVVMSDIKPTNNKNNTNNKNVKNNTNNKNIKKNRKKKSDSSQPYYFGLINVTGVSCFQNVIFQLFFHNPYLRKVKLFDIFFALLL